MNKKLRRKIKITMAVFLFFSQHHANFAHLYRGLMSLFSVTKEIAPQTPTKWRSKYKHSKPGLVKSACTIRATAPPYCVRQGEKGDRNAVWLPYQLRQLYGNKAADGIDTMQRAGVNQALSRRSICARSRDPADCPLFVRTASATPARSAVEVRAARGRTAANAICRWQQRGDHSRALGASE